jgi:hypothetical protein
MVMLSASGIGFVNFSGGCMKRKSLVLSAVALGLLSSSAFAMTPIGNMANKGSLLVYPRIDVGPGVDTLITLVNDSSYSVRLKCYYASSDPIPTPYSGTASSAKQYKHKVDFTIDLTHNQPVSWFASSGQVLWPSALKAGSIAPPFGNFPSGFRGSGEMKCWASSDDFSAERHWNHLFGTASVMNFGTAQAYEYTAWAFQAMGPATDTGKVLGSPGVLNLDNAEYDACPNTIVGDFIPAGAPPIGGNFTQLTLASCNQDLRQNYTPTITKLTYTFWNQDEMARTGNHACANSWYETFLPAANHNWLNHATYQSLGTAAAYFRIETTADTSICGASATRSAYVGQKAEGFGGGTFLRGTNLTGRGVANGVIRYDVNSPDEFKK